MRNLFKYPIIHYTIVSTQYCVRLYNNTLYNYSNKIHILNCN